MYRGHRLPQAIPADGCAYCIVFYGCKTDYLLMALVVARRLACLGVKHPLIVLPTFDVPQCFRGAFQAAGCMLQEPVEYLTMHPALLRSPRGRHCSVLTKLRCLGLRLPGLRKLLLIDSDILPRQSLDSLFKYHVPAAKLMPVNLDRVCGWQSLCAGDLVPRSWLDVDKECGTAPRFNAGVLLVEPDEELLLNLIQQAHPERDLFHLDGTLASSEVNQQRWEIVLDVFGKPWFPTWTPEEDLLTRGVSQARPLKQFTHIGTGYNFEVNSDPGHCSNHFLAAEHNGSFLDLFEKISVLHFSGSWKPTWWAWYVARGEMTVQQVQAVLREQYMYVDPNHVTARATAEWLSAFEELILCASKEWFLDIVQLVGWQLAPLVVPTDVDEQVSLACLKRPLLWDAAAEASERVVMKHLRISSFRVV